MVVSPPSGRRRHRFAQDDKLCLREIGADHLSLCSGLVGIDCGLLAIDDGFLGMEDGFLGMEDSFLGIEDGFLGI